MSPIELIIKTGYTLLGLRKGTDDPPPFEPQKVLVVRNDNLGDVLLTIPTLRALRQTFPQACLAVLVNAYTRPAVEGIPWIDKIYSYDKFKHGRHPTRLHAWWQQYQLIKELQEEGFDLAIGVRTGFSSSHGHLVYASAARWRLGRAPDKKRKNQAFFYNITVPKATQEKHEVEHSLDVVRTIGIDTVDKQLEFFIPSRCKQEIENWLNQQKIHPPLAGILLSQRVEEGRYWTTDKYVHLIDSLRQQGDLTPILIHAPSDAQITQHIQQTLKKKVTTFSTHDLKLLAALFRCCKAVTALNGGGMHLAAAVGTPTIAIFGKASTLAWHPWGKKHVVLRKENQENMVTAEDVLAALKRIGIDQPGGNSI